MRPVHERETPEFGSIWSWEDDGAPLMAIGPDPGRNGQHWFWRFVRLTGFHAGTETSLIWAHLTTGETLLEWWRHD